MNQEHKPDIEKSDNVADRQAEMVAKTLDKNEHFPSSPGKLEPDMYFQTVIIGSVKVKIDYHPKRVDIKGLREGNYFELINILPMEGLTLLLPKVELLSLKGIDIVGSKIGNIWGKEIVEKQLHHLAAGINVPPIRSLANVCNGACDVVLLPLKQYRKGGHISSSLRTSTSNFVHTLSLEALTNASRLAATTQTILESAHDYLASSSKVNRKKRYFNMATKKSKVNRKRNTSRKTYDKHHKNLPSVYSDQPANVTEALNQAAKRLSTRFNSSQRTVVAVPIGQYKEKGIGGTVHNVVKAMPVAILGPMIGGAEALSRVILGARNSLDPDLTFDQNEKYKSTKDLSMQTS
jgi:autophagy-related protein 2